MANADGAELLLWNSRHLVNKLFSFIIGIFSIVLILTPTPAHAENLIIPLQKLTQTSILNLKCVMNGYDISLPIPNRWKVKKASIHFNYINSATLKKEGSQLVVRVNKTAIGQRILDPDEPEGRADMNIPAHLLKSGYNNLSFEVAQHYTFECEQPCDPNLWTDIITEGGYVSIDYELLPVPMELAGVLDFLFDPKTYDKGRVNFVITEEISKTSDETLTVSAILASGISNRFDYLPVIFSVSRDIIPGLDNIVLGTKENISDFLDKKEIKVEIKGPYVKVAKLPLDIRDPLLSRLEIKRMMDKYGRILKIEQDPDHALIILSGLTDDHLKIAAESLAALNFPYPGVDEMTILEFNMEEIITYTGRKLLPTGRSMKFKKLGFSTYTFLGLQPNSKEISFRLPPDFLIKQNQYLKLSLNFSYAGGLRVESGLNILINGTFVTVISLDNFKGASIEGYEIDIPTYLFSPGDNYVTFKAVMTPKAGECELLQTTSLFLTIFDNSTMLFPKMPHFVKMPKIELFMLNGYPFTRWPDAFGSKVVLTQPTIPILEAALNTLAMISQKNGYPLFSISLAKETPKDWDGDIMFFGSIEALPDEIMEATFLRLKKESVVPYPVSKFMPDDNFAVNRQISGFGENSAAILEFKAPFKKSNTALLFTAQTQEAVKKLGEAMWAPGIQKWASKDFVIVEFNTPEYKTSSLKTAKPYFVGAESLIDKVRLYLYTNEYFVYGIGSIIALFFGISVIFLKRNLRKRTAIEEDGKIVDARKSFTGRITDVFLKLFIKGKEDKTDEEEDDEGGG